MIKWINKKRNKKGFTLIELVVVIAILGILAAIAIPRLSGFQTKAKEKVLIANEKLVNNMIQLYLADHDVVVAASLDALLEILSSDEVNLMTEEQADSLKIAEKDTAWNGKDVTFVSTVEDPVDVITVPE